MQKLLSILLVFLVLLSVSSCADAKEPDGYAKAWNESKRTGKPMLVFFTGDWCSWCKKMERETFTDPQVKERLEKDYVVYFVKDSDPYLTKAYKVEIYPSYFVVQVADKPLILRAASGFKTAIDFLKWLGIKHPVRTILSALRK